MSSFDTTTLVPREGRIAFAMRFTAILALLVLAGCEGEQGPAGPAGLSGESGPVSFLVFATSFEAEPLALGMYGVAGLPEGSTVDALNAFQGQVPALDDLMDYDVVVSFSRALAASDSLGDRLAEYVDAEGKVILAQGAFTEGLFDGRITEPGYSPFAMGPAAGETGVLRFDTSDFPRPVHSVFAGVNLGAPFSTAESRFSSPALQGDATLLARYEGDVNAVAINDDGSVLGINVFPDSDATAVVQLFASALLFMAGES